MYIGALAESHADAGTLVAWADTNPGRQDWHEKNSPGIGRPRRFAPEELDAVVAEENIDAVIVTTPDYLHATYVVAALEAGADAIVEKPLTINEEGIKAIAEAAERTGRKVTITFNYRYSPRNAELKKIIASGEIGEVTSVHFEWVLDTAHGADYFRRWHREKEHSGGLLIHKSTTCRRASTPPADSASTVPRTPHTVGSAIARAADPSTTRAPTRSASTCAPTRSSRASTSTTSSMTDTCATATCSTRTSRSKTTCRSSSTTSADRP
jgi:predicted dehydrogenase